MYVFCFSEKAQVGLRFGKKLKLKIKKKIRPTGFEPVT